MTIKVQFEQLAGTRDQINTGAANIEAQLADLKKFLQPLVSSWDGAAAESYHGAQSNWDKAAADLHQTLVAIVGALSSTHEGYQNTESSNTKLFSG